MISPYFSAPAVWALSEADREKFAQNNIVFYNPDGGNSDCNYDGGTCSGPAGNQITWIGDSYSVEALSIIQEKLAGVDLGTENVGNAYSPYSYIQYGKHMDWISNPGSTNDTAGGPSGMAVLDSISDLRPVLVFALGTNDTVSTSAMEATLNNLASKVGEETKVVLTTAYTRGGDYSAGNEAKKNFVAAHDNFYLADWAAVAKDEYYASDSVHPSSGGGYEAWVNVIYNALPQTCTGSSTNEIVEINGHKYTFPLLGATKANYLHPGSRDGQLYSVLSRLPCGAGNVCHHDYEAVDLGLRKLEVDGTEYTASDFSGSGGGFGDIYYYSTGVKVLAFVSGKITSYGYYTNSVPADYQTKCASVTYQGDDGYTYWLGHMSYDPTIHAGDTFNVGDVIGEVGPPPCAQSTQAHLHINVSPSSAHDRYIIDLIDQLYEHLPESGSANTAFASYHASSSAGSASTTLDLGGNLPAETIEYLDNAGVKDLAEQNMERYTYASEQTGLPWQAIAAVHFMEGGMRSNASILNGQEIGTTPYTNVDGMTIYPDANQDALEGAKHLIEMAQEVYGADLLNSPTIEDWGNAFVAYNRGYMYKDAGNTWDESPYAAAGMDEDHPIRMQFLYADSCYRGTCYNSLAGNYTNRPGAIAVMTYLGGMTGGKTSVCRNSFNRSSSGGLSEEQAEAIANYYKSDAVTDSEWNLPSSYGKWNCVSFSAWFIQRFTSVGHYVPASGWGNGKDVAEFMKQNKGIQTGTEPRPFSVFSVTQGVTDCGNVKCGHTGIVVAVNGNDVTTIEAAYGNVGYTAVVHRDLSYFVNAQYGDTFGYLDSIIDQDALQEFLAEQGV